MPKSHPPYPPELRRRLVELVRSGESQDLLERLFGLLERMATHPDAHVWDAMQAGVVNPLVDQPNLFELAKPFLGSRTLGMTRDL